MKGLIGEHFISVDNTKAIYGNHASTDIEAVIRRSEIELGNYELKQGLLTLADPGRDIDGSIQTKVVNTLCAIANNGPHSSGKLIVGVTDKEADADRIHQLDGVTPKKWENALLSGSRARQSSSSSRLRHTSTSGSRP